MHPNEALINKFYTAFARRDGEEMAACYHPNAEFSDEAFKNLRGKMPGLMWKMLCERGKDLQITFNNVQADDEKGRAHWEATYTFTQTGRKVHNVIDAEFKFKDGKIIDHRDSFNFWRWASQALGPVGMILGWTPFLRKKVEQQSKLLIEKYAAKHG